MKFNKTIGTLATVLITSILFICMVPTVYAQQVDSGSAAAAAAAATENEKPITVARKYVSSEGLSHPIQSESTPQKASEWIGVGKEIGEATKAGLDSVVDASEKFGASKVGTFVMVMIAWRIMAKDILDVVLGVPFLIVGTIIWWQIMKKFFFGYQVLASSEGRTKTYKHQDPYRFNSSDARAFAGALIPMVFIGFLIAMATIIF